MTEQKPSPLSTEVSETPAQQVQTDAPPQMPSARYLTQKNKETREEIQAYWTPERMAQARPTPPPFSRGQEPPQPATRPASTSMALYTLPVPYKRLTDYPFQSIGKLFFTVNGEDREGSAAVVAENGLITAAHNLYDHESDSWSEKIWFSPAYYKQTSQYGFWDCDKYFVLHEWETADKYSFILGYDVGFIRLKPGGKDVRAIGKVVKLLPLLVDMTLAPSKDIRWDAVGYPGVPPPDGSPDFDGEEMWVCAGNFKKMFSNIVDKEGNFTYGSSGGPWLYQRESGVYEINGIQTGGVPDKETDNSPYFGTWVLDFFDHCFPA